MPDQPRKQLHRYDQPNQARFLTFSCHNRKPYLSTPGACDAFAASLSKARTTYNFKLLAWVAMPDHIHLILIPDLPHWPVSKVLWGLKRGSATRIKQTMLGATADPKGSRAQPIWQPGGGYDRNIRDHDELNEKINYIHNNPVRRARWAGHGCPSGQPWRRASFV